MNVNLDQMKAWNRWQHQAAMRKIQKARKESAMAVMKKPAKPKQLRLL